MAIEVSNIQLYNSLNTVFKKINCWLKGSAASHASLTAYDSMITDMYHRILARRPNHDEMLHWNYFLGSGTSIKLVENSLKESYEYDQLRNRQDIMLIDLQLFKIFCRSSDLDVGKQIIQTQKYEPHVTSILTEVLKPGHVMVDLGANIGYFSLLAMTLVGDNGKVIAIEPNVRNLQLLYASIVENKMKNIFVLPLAASHLFQILRLQTFGSNGFLDVAAPGQAGAQYVQTVILDEILHGVPHIDTIKMDIEGFEPFALKGMTTIIETHRPLLITEFSPWHIEHRCGLHPKEYLDQLTSHGYRLSIIKPSGIMTPAKDPDAVMNFWREFQNDKVHLDLIGYPS
jgi:FkbM family methyltransferase